MTPLKSACTTEISYCSAYSYFMFETFRAPRKRSTILSIVLHQCYFHNLNQFIFSIYIQIIPMAMLFCIWSFKLIVCNLHNNNRLNGLCSNIHDIPKWMCVRCPSVGGMATICIWWRCFCSCIRCCCWCCCLRAIFEFTSLLNIHILFPASPYLTLFRTGFDFDPPHWKDVCECVLIWIIDE